MALTGIYNSNDPVGPFLKWVGGKRQILESVRRFLPGGYQKYHEPFLGGGAVFFDLQPKHAFLSDANRELIDTYLVVRDQVEKLISRLSAYVYEEKEYYRIRGLDPWKLEMVDRAARMIYLNKTGFNGLYRVNSKGGFNVPFGRHNNPRICNAEKLRSVSTRLHGVNISCSSFESVLDTAEKGDFVYFDPPYVPLSQSPSFVAYQKRGFGMDRQEHLAAVFEELDGRGCNLMLSNSDVPWTRDRYKGFQVHSIEALRLVNSKSSKRGPVGEIIVTNY